MVSREFKNVIYPILRVHFYFWQIFHSIHLTEPGEKVAVQLMAVNKVYTYDSCLIASLFGSAPCNHLRTYTVEPPNKGQFCPF